MYIRRSEDILNVLCTLNLRPVSLRLGRLFIYDIRHAITNFSGQERFLWIRALQEASGLQHMKEKPHKKTFRNIIPLKSIFNEKFNPDMILIREFFICVHKVEKQKSLALEYLRIKWCPRTQFSATYCL